MTTLPPYPPPSELEERALAEEQRQAALEDSPQVRRNLALLAAFAMIGGGVFLSGLLVYLLLELGAVGVGLWFLFVLVCAWVVTRRR